MQAFARASIAFRPAPLLAVSFQSFGFVMRRLAVALLSALTILLPLGAVWGAIGTSEGKGELTTRMELVVFESNGCTYCEVFRRNVVPLYRVTEKSRVAPLRFVNLSRADETKLRLSAPITMVPTVVLLEDGQELGRVTGYTGPESFLDLVAAMMGETN